MRAQVGQGDTRESATPVHNFCGYDGNSWLNGRGDARTSTLTGLSKDLSTSANGFMRIDEGAGHFNAVEPHRLWGGTGAPVPRT